MNMKNAYRTGLLAIALSLTAGSCLLPAQTVDPEHLNIGAYARYNNILDGQGIYLNLLDSHGYDLYGLSAGLSTRPEDGNWYEWAFNYPTFGLGLSYGRSGSLAFKNQSRLGDIANLYGWAEFDLVRTRVFRFGPLLELGLAFTGQTYDYHTNPANRFIGSPVFALIGTGLQAEWLFTPQWALTGGVYLTHHSNGMLRAPNLGINEFSVGAGVRRYLAPVRFTPRSAVHPEQPAFPKGLHWQVFAAAGVHSCPVELDGILKSGAPDRLPPARLRAVLGTELLWRYSPIFATGVGAELDYAANNYRETDRLLTGGTDPAGYSPLRAGLYLIQEFRYRQVSVHLAAGCYLFKRTGLTEDVGRTFQKLGARYHFARAGGLFAGLDMRAHQMDRSYSLEWSLGYSF